MSLSMSVPELVDAVNLADGNEIDPGDASPNNLRTARNDPILCFATRVSTWASPFRLDSLGSTS